MIQLFCKQCCTVDDSAALITDQKLGKNMLVCCNCGTTFPIKDAGLIEDDGTILDDMETLMKAYCDEKAIEINQQLRKKSTPK